TTPCADFCDVVHVCAELERGECMLNMVDGITAVSVQRTLFSFRFRIQNCSDGDITLNPPQLNLTDRLLFVPADQIEQSVTAVISNWDDIAPLPGVPRYRTLVLTSTCGTANLSVPNDLGVDYEGGLEV